MSFSRPRFRRIPGFASLSFAVFLTAATLGRPAAAPAADAVGEVVQQRGVVTAARDGARRALHIGAPVQRGDEILTGDDAKVAIRLADGSSLSVGPASRIEISDFLLDGRGGGVRGILTLLVGICRTSLSGLWGDRFEVRSQAAVASVRATDWVTEATADGTAVFVVEGEVAVAGTADGSTVVLRQGDGTDVKHGAAPTPPRQWGAPRVQDVLARTTVP